MEFEFATATRIVFGSGTLAQAAASAEAMGQRTLLVTGSTPERTEPLQLALARHHVEVVIFPVQDEQIPANPG